MICWRCVVCLLVCWVSGLPVSAQITGAIGGAVSDPSGAVVAGAPVVLMESGTGATRELTTDSRGRYLAPMLAPGTYQVEVSQPGFRAEVRSGVVVSVGKTTREDFRLQIGELRDEIEVTAQAGLLSVAANDWGGSFASRELDALPLKGRDLYDLATQEPGAQQVTAARRGLSQGAGIPVTVNGARPNMNSFRLDGLYINDASANAPASAAGRILGIESIQELHLITSPFSAEFGRSAGGVLTAVSKSGSNSWHGSSFYYTRNSALDAKNYFDAANQDIPPLRNHHFGGLIGGPVVENRLFFLSNYEGIRETASRTERPATLTAAARQGALAGGAVAVNPLVAPYLDLYPLPNGRDFGDGTGEFITQVDKRTREDYFAGKLDYLPTSRLRLAGRYTFDDGDSAAPDHFHLVDLLSDSRYQFLSADGQYIPSPSAIHNIRLGWSRVSNSELWDELRSFPPELSFVPGQTIGNFRVTGLGHIVSGSSGQLFTRPRIYRLNDLQSNYDATLVRGAHTWRFGVSHGYLRFNQRADQSLTGTYRFTSVRDLLLGRPRSGDVMGPDSDTRRRWRIHQFSAFVQDEYRLTRTLNLSLGLRYDGHTTPTEADGKISRVPDPARDTAVTVGGPMFENPSRRNFAPRASLAWDPTGSGRSVIRAGAGIFYDLLGTRDLLITGVRMPPFFVRLSPVRPSFPNLLESALQTKPDPSMDLIDYRIQQPYMARYQLTLEQRVTGGATLKLSYTGARGVHLAGEVREYNVNLPVVTEDGRLYFPEDAAARNPALGKIRFRTAEFNSFYHGFTAGLQRRWRNALGFLANYTFSKSLDDNSTSSVGRDYADAEQLPTVFNIRDNYGPSAFDVRHAFTANVSWELPRWRAWTNRVFGGWQAHGLFQARTGPAFSPAVGFDRANLTPAGDDLGQRPDVIGSPSAGDVILGDPARYFDPMAYSLPEAGFLGNLGRNTLHGPGAVELDLSLHKDVWRTERSRLRLQIEAFNVLNRPNFQVPSGIDLFRSGGVRVGSAGRITETVSPSRQLRLGVKWTF